MNIPAIPTMYRGIRFRSRLEAKWAAFFDALELTWDYEPVDMRGWIPDFRIGDALLDVKPWTTFDATFTAKLEHAGDPLVSYVLASSPTAHGLESFRQIGWDAYGCPLVLGYFAGIRWNFSRMYRADDGQLRRKVAPGFPGADIKPARAALSTSGGMTIDDAWRRACNPTQWQPVPQAAPRKPLPAVALPVCDDEDLFQ